MSGYTVLLVEDHKELAATTGEYLEDCDFIVDYAMDGITGLHLTVTNQYDALVLDVMLPGMDGFTICERVRKELKSDIPIIMLTARDQLGDKLEGFETGADDYLIKPFELEELEARLIALIRRYRGELDEKTLEIHDLVLDQSTMLARRDGQLLKLSPTGLQILRYLMRKSPNLVTRDELIRELWGEMVPNSDVLRSHLYNLRKVIDKPFDTHLMHTKPGLGFKILAPDVEF